MPPKLRPSDLMTIRLMRKKLEDKTDGSDPRRAWKQNPGLGKLIHLPPELRDKIFHQVCGYRKILITVGVQGLERYVYGLLKAGNGIGAGESPNTLSVNILLVSKSFSERMAWVLYSNNLFTFYRTSYLNSFCRQISTASRQSITQARLQLQASKSQIRDFVNPATALLQLPNLRYLTLSMDAGWRSQSAARDKVVQERNQSTKFPRLECARIELEYFGPHTEYQESIGALRPNRCFEIVSDILGLTLPASSDGEVNDEELRAP